MTTHKTLPNYPNRVRELRMAKGLTQGELGALVGLGVAHVSRIENGKRDLTQYWMEKFSLALDVAPVDLLGGEYGGLTPEERQLIDTYREIPAHMRTTFDALRESHQPFRRQGEVVDMPRKASGEK
jgi:transcriptional regulator with XRE-family HTH domain